MRRGKGKMSKKRKFPDYPAKWTRKARLPEGTPGYKVAALAGSITDADAEQMLRIIEEGCERIEPEDDPPQLSVF